MPKYNVDLWHSEEKVAMSQKVSYNFKRIMDWVISGLVGNMAGGLDIPDVYNIVRAIIHNCSILPIQGGAEIRLIFKNSFKKN